MYLMLYNGRKTKWGNSYELMLPVSFGLEQILMMLNGGKEISDFQIRFNK